MAQKTEQIIEGEVLAAIEQQRELAEVEQALMQNEQFKRFIALRTAVNQKWDDVRKHVEAVMVPAYQAGEIDKTLKADWGSITVTESDRFDIDTKVLPAKFFKRVPDETRIRATFQLEGKAPKGTTHKKRYGIQMKVKQEEA